MTMSAVDISLSYSCMTFSSFSHKAVSPHNQHETTAAIPLQSIPENQHEVIAPTAITGTYVPIGHYFFTVDKTPGGEKLVFMS